MNLEEIERDLKRYRRPKYKGFVKPPSDQSIEQTLTIIDQLTKSGMHIDYYAAIVDGGTELYTSFGEDTYYVSIENGEPAITLTILDEYTENYRYLEFFSVKGLVFYLTKNIN